MIVPRPRWLPWLELLLGLAMATAGILHTLWALPHEWAEVRLAAHHGVALLGVVVVLRALAEIALQLEFAGSLAAPRAPRGWAWLRACVTHPRAEVLVGVLVTAAGLSEAYQLLASPHPDSGIWHWGVVLAGLLITLRTAHALHEGIEHLEKARVGPQCLRKLALVLERPGPQVLMATALLILAGLEAALPVEAPAGEGAGAPVGHHGLAAFGGLHLARSLPALASSAKLIWRRFTATEEKDAA
ncbi:MAG: hypothetical protein VKQ33_14515 [Candidatus Sericytochromatia bacterium]|nr:hypothetical protein [Candidatus Sericytochromatia bacterium]